MSQSKHPYWRWLALGDSYTSAEGIDPSGGWPTQLYERLKQAGLTIQPPLVIAQNGWTCSELCQGIGEQPPTGVFDLVTVLIGANNHYRGMTVAAFQQELLELFRLCGLYSKSGNSGVLWISIPDWVASPFGQKHEPGDVRETLNHYNECLERGVIETGCHWTDITGLSRSMAGQESMFAQDGLHPSALQYNRWLTKLEPAVRGILTGHGGVE